MTSDGVLAIEVYESVEAADRLVADEVGPLSAPLGLNPPPVTQHEVIHVLTP
ncbi:hypothetical protein BH10ACT2_BH10ACT2_18410 [soil metagenome]